MKFIIAAFTIALLSGCVTTVQYDEFSLAMTVREEETGRPIPDLLVYLIHTDHSKKDNRFGPFRTDSTGTCIIEISERRIKYKGLPFGGDSIQFEIYPKGSDLAITRTVRLEAGETSAEIEIPKQEEA